MHKFIILVSILSAVFLLACGSASDGSAASIRPAATPTPAPFFTNNSKDSLNLVTLHQNGGPEGLRGPAGAAGPQGPAGAPAPEPGFGFSDAEREEFAVPGSPLPPTDTAGEDGGSASSTLQTEGRKIISTASLSIEVEVVESSIDQVRTIADSVGGFVEHLSSFGSDQNQQANITVRVPQDQFFNAVQRLEALGKVQNRNLGSEDVSEEFIDLEARLKSAKREEESLLSLLDKAERVADVLTIERELSRVRAEVERLQGRLNFLERRVDLATISVSLFPPGERVPEPPAASMLVEDSRVSERVSEVKNLVSSLGGEMDRVFLSTRNGRERADISFRVFPKDFDQAMSTLEGRGKVISKEVREGVMSSQEDAETPDDPNSRIDVSFTQPEPADFSLLLWVGAPILGVVIVLALAVAFYLTYRAGRHRRDRYVQSAG